MNFAKGGGVRDIYAPLELINCNVNAKQQVPVQNHPM